MALLHEQRSPQDAERSMGILTHLRSELDKLKAEAREHLHSLATPIWPSSHACRETLSGRCPGALGAKSLPCHWMLFRGDHAGVRASCVERRLVLCCR